VPLRRWSILLWSLALAANAASLYMVFFYAPVEVQMGAVQKIFYYHVPSAIVCYVLLFLAFLFSVLYLWREEALYDHLAHSAAEVGWVFITIVLVTGPIWGHSAWGKWWVWEPRLTSFLILWLTYSAYFLLRLFSRGDARAAKIAAVVAIVAFFDVPIVHPRKVVLEPAMRWTFFVGLASVFLLAAALCVTRFAIQRAEASRAEKEEWP